MIPYWEQDFYGDELLAPILPVFRLLPRDRICWFSRPLC